MDEITLFSNVMLAAITLGLLIRAMREDWAKNGDFYKARWAERRKQWQS